MLRPLPAQFEIEMATDEELIEAYSNSPFDFDDDSYDRIATEMAKRGILEI